MIPDIEIGTKPDKDPMTNDQPSALCLRALQFARFMIFKGIRGGMPGWGRCRGTEVDAYLRSVDVALPPTPSVEGAPWDWAGLFFAHQESERPGEVSNCPKTASALEAAELAPEWCKLPGPRQGAVGVLKQPDGTGRAVQCEVAFPDGSVATVEGDGIGEESHAGDAWARATWNPADGKRGTVLGWFDFGIQAPPSTVKPAPEPEEKSVETPAVAENEGP